VFCGQEQNGLTKGKTWKCRSSPQSSIPGNCATFSSGRWREATESATKPLPAHPHAPRIRAA